MALPVVYEPKQLDLIRKTVAKDCDVNSKGISLNLGEFDLFIENCRALNLNPLRRQVYAFVFNKDDPGKRQLTIVTSIGGYRTIADRTGNYRPGDCRCETREELRDHDGNPAGIEYAEATVWKYAHGEWFSVTERAYWSEFAPVKEVPSGGWYWVDTGKVYPDGHDKAGQPIKAKKPAGEMVYKLDERKDQWRKMPRVMLEKCAEAKALRRAWPDDFANVYVEEEMDFRQSIELTATELAEAGASEKRMALIGGPNCLTVDWCDGEPLCREPVGAFGDKVLKLIAEQPDIALVFESRNRHALKEYWALDKSGALAVKAAYEKLKSETRSMAAE